MKDRQASIPLSSGKIPILSPILHCLAMPVLVFWRWDFGYSYLSPKAIFLSCIFSCSLLSYIVWHDPDYAAAKGVSAFALTASFLYLIHLVRSIHTQVRESAEHDQFSGKSHLLGLCSAEGQKRLEGAMQMGIEPALTLLASYLLKDTSLGAPLKFFGIAFAAKELLRAWLDLRWNKRLKDNLDDSGDTLGSVMPEVAIPVSAKGRTRSVERKRASGDDETEG